MDKWLNDAPALLYFNNTWVVVNKWCELLSWTEDSAEVAWIMRCVLEQEQTEPGKKQKDKPQLKVVRGRRPSRVSVTSESASPCLILPNRKLS